MSREIISADEEVDDKKRSDNCDGFRWSEETETGLRDDGTVRSRVEVVESQKVFGVAVQLTMGRISAKFGQTSDIIRTQNMMTCENRC